MDPSQGELKVMVKTADADNSGTLSFAEFVKLMLREVNKSKMDEIRGFFRDFDLNGDGMITADEVRKVFTLGGFPDREVERIIGNMMRGTDFDKDGKIKFEGKVVYFKMC